MKRHGGLLARSITAGLMLAAGSAFGATSVDDVGLFELDGNATNVVATPGDDWDQIYCKFNSSYAGCAGVAAPSGLFTSVFAIDPVNSASDDISAGAKDSLDIRLNVPQDWAWKIGEPNDKNDIEHAFASIYRGGDNNDFYLYFGLTKLSNDGDAAIGFWFLQNDVGKTNETLGGGYRFSAGHRPGDVLVQSNFTNGGEVSLANVYTWGSNAFLNEAIAPAQGLLTKAWDAAVCDPTAFTEDACVRVNTSAVPAPWPYIYKFSGGPAASTEFPTATFFEGGLNLTKLFGGEIPCISTFVGETRQSQSETAELEDFVLAQFKLCSIQVAKKGPDNGKMGDYDLSYKITITNDGALTLSRYSIIDSLQGDLTNAANYSTSTCGETLAPEQSCEITYTRTAGTSSPVENMVDVVYKRVTTTRTDTVTASDKETVPLKKPAVTLDKSSPLEGKTVFTYVPVKYDFDVKNTGDTTLDCVLSDPMFGDSFKATISGLAAGATYSASYDYAGFTTGGTKKNTASVMCDVVGFSNQVSADDSVTVKVLERAPAVTVMKTGDDYSKLGDTVAYSVKISNLTILPVNLTAIMDSLAGDLKKTTAPVTSNTCATTSPAYQLAGNSDCTITYNYTVVAADLSSPPLDNEVNVTWADTVVGSETTVGDDHEVTLVSPNYTITKSCGPEPAPAGSAVNFDIKVTNTGDVPLNVKVTDSKLGIDTTASLGKVSGS